MLAQGQLADTPETLYVVPGSTRSYIKTILLFNSGTASAQATLYLVPNSSGALATPSAANKVLVITLEVNETFEFSPAYPIEYSSNNDAIFGEASVANVVNYFILGVEKG